MSLRLFFSSENNTKNLESIAGNPNYEGKVFEKIDLLQIDVFYF